ncbi:MULTISPECIES: LysR substrate-binding domain-containing protein [Methylobacterium]|uniref:HTH-type transcriptional regulator CysL n=1 Tax=Methylobacterium jeotgali TaxID=381630 RepID=A0ABQ4SWT2_9HYPH|nr:MULTISPECIES: LysR substrate-binding domain-containing protein [Methylobacterium]PIU06023.1 MAG: LysR family transcriptional regulator [Methylobacterium sp. CG09_land_8_20_14_0_10_71_15]PIU11776.1 MAG: LysR family transcriptional regulator [Methylobacterium sp. CG08_land_8_20_14_0_20_71_15]GBU16312.1 transcriptional activator [Methylobacterium sp.]GJE07557.1 HTH-type transcriptional regulator CysL [Methylobacterium jeotgali]
MLRFDLVDLGLFRAVVEAGSITHGAARANLALAAASTRIRAMEESLGAPLLKRHRQGVEPTTAGRVLLVHARALLAGVDRMREELSAFSGGAAGRIRVVSNTNALSEFLPEALSAFLADHPGVDVDVDEHTSDEIVGLVAEGAADLGILSGHVDTGALRVFPLRHDRFVLVTAPGHPLAGRAEVSFAEALDHELVGLDRASAVSRFLGERAARIGKRMRLRVRLRSFEAVCRLAECGLGLGIVPESTARRAARSAAIAVVPLSDPWASRDLTLCLRDLAALPGFTRDFVAHLRDGAGAPGV